MVDDAALVEAWRRGDRGAGSTLFERHYDGVVRFFRNKVGDVVASDLVQKTFLACFEGLAAYRGEASLRTYLYAIAYRLLCKHYEAQRRNRIDLGSVSVHDLRALAERGAGGPRGAAPDARGAAAPADRVSGAARAALLGADDRGRRGAGARIPEGTAKTRLRRGRQLLAAQLAALASSPELLTRTNSDLEGWARGLREQVLPAPPRGAR
ncbi:sigma factor [Nannocystis sp.]|uniref:RNA polymerase sigma factor n=1 Tax=Nannocystis sp. TaxID=1962667 RepID=UPI0025F78393|nr:sigma factor [Nannocystis sp.]